VTAADERIPVPAGRWDVARRFGSVLRELRQQRGLTQETLAELADLDRTYPGLLERGLRTPTLAVVLRLANALGTEPSRLITETALRLQLDDQDEKVRKALSD
jgi:XRE family transcriptional regulator, regulator of sulfur utilization